MCLKKCYWEEHAPDKSPLAAPLNLQPRYSRAQMRLRKRCRPAQRRTCKGRFGEEQTAENSAHATPCRAPLPAPCMRPHWKMAQSICRKGTQPSTPSSPRSPQGRAYPPSMHRLRPPSFTCRYLNEVSALRSNTSELSWIARTLRSVWTGCTRTGESVGREACCEVRPD